MTRSVLGRRAGHAVGAALAAAVAFVATAPGAAAHGTADAASSSSNYRLDVTGTPAVDGISVTVADGSTHLVLTNVSPRVVVVLDYQGRPYLRVGPDGVFENSNSPAVVLNTVLDPDDATDVPEGTDRVRWTQISSGHTVSWHDHRAHWMTSTPLAVEAAPDVEHTVLNWTVPVEVDGNRAEITGTITWVPPPSILPAIVVFTVVGALVLVALQRRPEVTLLSATVAVLLLQAAHVAGRWVGSTEGIGAHLSDASIPFLTTAMLAGAAITVRSDRRDAVRIAAVGAAATIAVTAVTSATWMTHSQFPSALGAQPARLTIAAMTGIAAGVLVWSLRAIVTEHSPTRSRIALAVRQAGRV